MIGWYVHHQGRGHRTRASTVAAHLDEPVTVLSSLEPDPAQPHLGWLRLARDDGTRDPGGAAAVDPTAGGVLHWAPRGDPGLRGRMAAIAAWVEREQPRIVVVDVSVEVTLLLRLLGVPVVVVAMPGQRTDPPHRAAYAAATALLAPWPAALYRPDWLAEHEHKTTYTGAISRFAGRTDGRGGKRGATRGVVLGGAGGSAVTASDLAELAGAVPDLDWQVLGPGGRWVPDPWPALREAAVVISHAGLNAIADVATAAAPAVIIPQDRPFDEQRATAAALAAAGLASTSRGWPRAGAWVGLVEAARATGGRDWERWAPRDAAACAAAAVAAVADGTTVADLTTSVTEEVTPCGPR